MPNYWVHIAMVFSNKVKRLLLFNLNYESSMWFKKTNTLKIASNGFLFLPIEPIPPSYLPFLDVGLPVVKQ